MKVGFNGSTQKVGKLHAPVLAGSTPLITFKPKAVRSEEPAQLQSEGLFAGALRTCQLAVVVSAAVATTVLALPQPCEAVSNVRVEDVESSTMRAGLEAANDGKLDVAERFFRIYLNQEETNSASAWSNLGNVHLQMGKPDEAQDDYSKAIALAPDAPVPYLNRAISRESLGIQAAQQGNASLSQQLFQDAIADCNAAIERDSDEFAAWFNRGNVEQRLGAYDAALISFNRAADLAPGIAGYRLRAATIAYQTGDVDKARSQMRGLVRKYGNYAEAHAALAALDWAQGDRERAEDEYRKAMELNGEFDNLESVKQITRWPPALYEALARLLNINTDLNE